MDAHGEGVGDITGEKYRWNDSFEHYVEHWTAGGGITGNLIRRTNLISKGPLENTNNWLTAHFTLTPNGDVTVERFDFQSTCLN